MLMMLLGSFLKDALGVMKPLQASHGGGGGLLSKSAAERRKVLEEALGKEYPAVLMDYLCEVNEEGFLRDLRGAMDFKQSGFLHNEGARGILDALAAYVVGDFARSFDDFDREFFFADGRKRDSILREVFRGESALMREVRDYVMSGTYQDIAEAAQGLLQQVKNAPTVVIQAALEIPAEMRRKIREALAKKYENSFIEFQINPQIIGGLRVFINGEVVDHSWLSQIQRITKLTYQFS